MDIINLENNKVTELREFAKDLGLKLQAGVKKQEIIELIKIKLRQDGIDSVQKSQREQGAETTDNRSQNRSVQKAGGEAEVPESAGAAESGAEPKRAEGRLPFSERSDQARPQAKSLRNTRQDAPAEAETPPSSEDQRRINYAKKYYNTSNPAIPGLISGEDVGTAEGVLEILEDGYGFLRCDNYLSGKNDVYISPSQIKRFNMRTGDMILGKIRKAKETDKFPALLYVDKINGDRPEKAIQRPKFDDLIPIHPNSRMRLEVKEKPKELATRIIDLVAPIGKGQRGLVVSPPKAGKTTLLQNIANSITHNYPESQLIVLLVDERPEEVTDMRENIDGDIVYSTFDQTPEHHIQVAEMVLNRAQRLVEQVQDVVILLDSITRLARAYNLSIPPSGRTLTGGLDPAALHKPKRFFGAARNIRNGGSLTIIATALIDTGSRMDDVIYEEFKGTGNMEIHLDRKLSEKRIFPAVDLNKSGTRREELLLTPKELQGVYTIRKNLSEGRPDQVMEIIINDLAHTLTNEDFIDVMLMHFTNAGMKRD